MKLDIRLCFNRNRLSKCRILMGMQAIKYNVNVVINRISNVWWLLPVILLGQESGANKYYDTKQNEHMKMEEKKPATMPFYGIIYFLHSDIWLELLCEHKWYSGAVSTIADLIGIVDRRLSKESRWLIGIHLSWFCLVISHIRKNYTLRCENNFAKQ